MMRRWNELPKSMQNDSVKEYYNALVEKQSAIRLKRGADVLFALILTILLSPAMLGIAVWIKLDSRGPVFYRQERITRYGKPYRIFKFRTMVADADKKGPLVTKSRDERITQVGEKLRKLRLDEIPQLLNVLSGDMSFVGTRPEVKKYVDVYSHEMMATLLLPAGITSRTSIVFKDEDALLERCMKKEHKTAEEAYVEDILPAKMKYNLQYVRSFSLIGDLKIMWKTVFAVLR